jgi:phage portal protein BeeE
MTAVDSQLIEQLKWSAEAVCSAFHVPAYKIGVGQMPTHDNIEALTKDYYSQCLQKLIEDYELCVDDGLGLDTSKMRTELDLDGLFRMDSKTQMESLGLGVDKALMAPNEARKRLNLKPLPGGDTVYMQQQNYSLEALNERDKNDPFSKPEPVAPQEPDEPQEPEEDDIEEQARMFALLVEKEIASELARA